LARNVSGATLRFSLLPPGCAAEMWALRSSTLAVLTARKCASLASDSAAPLRMVVIRAVGAQKYFQMHNQSLAAGPECRRGHIVIKLNNLLMPMPSRSQKTLQGVPHSCLLFYRTEACAIVYLSLARLQGLAAPVWRTKTHPTPKNWVSQPSVSATGVPSTWSPHTRARYTSGASLGAGSTPGPPPAARNCGSSWTHRAGIPGAWSSMVRVWGSIRGLIRHICGKRFCNQTEKKRTNLATGQVTRRHLETALLPKSPAHDHAAEPQWHDNVFGTTYNAARHTWVNTTPVVMLTSIHSRSYLRPYKGYTHIGKSTSVLQPHRFTCKIFLCANKLCKTNDQQLNHTTRDQDMRRRKCVKGTKIATQASPSAHLSPLSATSHLSTAKPPHDLIGYTVMAASLAPPGCEDAGRDSGAGDMAPLTK
jgi:hypothetical protein